MTTQTVSRSSGGNVIPVREFSSAEELRAHQARLRAKFFPVAPPPPRPPEAVVAEVAAKLAILARDEDDPVYIEYRKELKRERSRRARAKERAAREAAKAAAGSKKKGRPPVDTTDAARREYFRLWAEKRRQDPVLRKFDNAIKRARAKRLKEENPAEYERKRQRRNALRRERRRKDKEMAALEGAK